MRVLVVGASGYGGGELFRLLRAHPAVAEIQGTSRAHAGEPVSSIHQNLRGLCDQPFLAAPDWNWLAESGQPVLFAAMPHGELSGVFPQWVEEWEAKGLSDRLTVIDLSADFRIQDPALYQAHYATAHPCPDLLEQWMYALPEFNREQIRGKKWIAAPGCFATGLQIGLKPLIDLRVEQIMIAGMTGSSGSGMSPSQTTHHPMRANDLRAYKVLGHQHIAEVTQFLRSKSSIADVAFVPHSAPLVRGIFLTLMAILPPGVDSEQVQQKLQENYADEPFIRLVKGTPRVEAVVGSNFLDISATVHGRQVAVLVALDNLMKGMAGQAVQAMNIALDLSETSGLNFAGPYPL
ncbi:MAG: N-acetyl-gamma-glutamyl-phosphate reductase [Armatimonadetes bacterium]|nr:N-acetyl-gamma-glutamyl-phosphate reductase [Armatimonadota bacterium]